jgi:phosphopantothenoylcysteine decarboxylase/phosphopantothenate--cysteine ligase
MVPSLVDLEHKNILIGVSGSIAAYKTLELIRHLVKSQANVKVIMTDSAAEFITPLTFEVLSGHKVATEAAQSWENNRDFKGDNHITLAKWADLFVLAPLSVNTLNKWAQGICDNILLQTLMAYNKEIIIAPAANTQMLNNPLTQNSLKTIQSLLPVMIVSTQSKELACKDVGDGAMAEPLEIYHTIVKALYKDPFWTNKKVIINGGGTIEKIDDVRYISNYSTGKSANELAKVLYYKGAEVTLITTASKETTLPLSISIKPVQSSNEMLESIQAELKKTNEKKYFFATAAVSDYVPNYTKGKVKKEDQGSVWELKLKQNSDILKTIDKSNLFTVGYKLEYHELNALKNAKNMIEKKSLDLVCLNFVKNNPFGETENDITLVSTKTEIHLGSDTKLNQAFKIVDAIKDIETK